MATLAELQADLENLKTARRTGALKITFGGREITYRSDRELATAISSTEAEINAAQGAPRSRNVVLRSVPYRGW